eukprot:UN18763
MNIFLWIYGFLCLNFVIKAVFYLDCIVKSV